MCYLLSNCVSITYPYVTEAKLICFSFAFHESATPSEHEKRPRLECPILWWPKMALEETRVWTRCIIYKLELVPNPFTEISSWFRSGLNQTGAILGCVLWLAIHNKFEAKAKVQLNLEPV